MNSVLRLVASFLIALGFTVSPCRVLAHEDDLPTAGHSFHGEAFDEGPRQSAYLMDGMPKLEFPVTTTNALALRFFVQGVGQLHGFWYFEAERSFRQVSFLDTNCTMALWGMAMANVSNEKRAREFMEKAVAQTNLVTLTRREHLYLASLAKFYGVVPVEPKKEASTANEKTDTQAETKEAKKEKKSPTAKLSEEAENKRHREYIKSLEQIVEDFPDDIEAKAFLVFKIWENQGRMKVSSHMATEALAREVLAVSPMHPVHHGRIHFWNGEVDRRALDAAARCGQGSSGIAHMWHMPGHTYSSLHRYADATWQQEASARVDHAYMIRNGVLPDQIHNFAHNNDWLVKNLNYLGRVSDAIDLSKNMIELPRHPKYNNFSRLTLTNSESTPSDTAYKPNNRHQSSASFGRARLMETLIQWEMWDELIALGNTPYLDPTDLPEEEASRHKALALAYFAKGDVVSGVAQLGAMDEVLKTQREFRAADVDAAETRARAEKQSKELIEKAMTDAIQSHAESVNATHKAMDELHLFEALAKGETDIAKKLAAEVKGVPKERMARVWLQLEDKDKAVLLAKEAVENNTNQVQVLANYTDILWQCGKTNEAVESFQRLRALASLTELDLPAMKRLHPLAERLELPNDWRQPFQPSTDVGVRPSLNSLGPFRWHPVPAPEWELPDSDGKKVSLKDFKGRPVVLIFYLGFGCKHCLDQLNVFSPMARRFAEAGITLLAVSTDSAEGLKKTFAQSKESDGFPFPILSNENLDAFKKYRAFDDFENMPLHGTFLVDGAGLVRWQDISFEPFVYADFLLTESRRLLKLPANPTLAATLTPLPLEQQKAAVLPVNP